MPFPAPEETVRLMFEARDAGDVRWMSSLVHPDALHVFAIEQNGRRTEVMAHRFQADGDDVIAYGRIRIVEGGALADSPAAWRITVRDGIVVKITPVSA